MKGKFHLLGGLGLLMCAILFAFREKDNPTEDVVGTNRAAAGAGFRGSRERASGDKVRSPRAGKPKVAGYREELTRVLNVALDSEDGDALLTDFVKRRADGDFLAVMIEVRSNGEFAARRIQMEEALVRSWSISDPDGALDWASNLPEWERDQTYERVCRNAASKLPARAMQALLDSSSGEADGELAENIADSWATRDLAGLIKWAEALPSGDLRDRMFAKASEGQSAGDPRAAVALALSEIPAGELQENVAISIVREWGTRDPEGAAEWVDRFPDEELQARARFELGSAQHAASRR